MNNTRVVFDNPLHGGFLSDQYRRGLAFPKGTRFDNLDNAGPWAVEREQLFDIIEVLYQIAKGRDTDIAQTALNYLLKKQDVCSSIIGVRNYEQLETNLKAIEWEMTEAEISRLYKISEPVSRYPYYVFNPEKDKVIPEN